MPHKLFQPMSVYDLQAQLCKLPPDMETSVGDIKIVEGKNWYQRAALVPVDECEADALVKADRGGSLKSAMIRRAQDEIEMLELFSVS